MLTIAFSGHRPNNKSMGGYDWHSPKNELIMKKLKFTIVNLINCKEEKEVTFITGGALGIDQMAFDIVEGIKLNPSIQLKYINIKQILAMPFKNQDAKWFNPLDIDELKHEQCVADEVVLVDKLDRYKIKGYQEDIYYPAKMQKRNEWMIDNCDILIAVWDGSRGGTCNCVKYCKKQNKEIIRINPSNLSEVSIC